MIFGNKMNKLRRQVATALPPGIGGEPMPFETPQAQTQQKGPSRFVGSILDGLSVATGGEANYLNGVQAQRQAQLEAQAAAAKRQADMADYEAKQQIEAKYRAPQVNDTERDYAFYTGIFGEDKAKELIARPQYFQQSDGRFVQMGGFNPNDAPASSQSPPQQPAADPAEIERFVMSFPREAQPAIRAKIAEGALGSVPSGSPVAQPPRTKRLSNGTTAYFVNGAWYDNPEGR